MKPVYESNQHFHLGYYENSKDIEAIAYKIIDEDVWDVYLDFNEQNLSNTEPRSNYVKNFGYKIFSIHVDDLSYETANKEFEKWLLQKGLIHKEI
ncbi:DUF3986 family protein [Fictibacillus barbaricus]|uniref:DUF3986 family protein n=1 Tax=Fictibacillus barbaricus TaxID=182136 RepID=A0ABU1U1F0_9BACL|nr:DUF3986 family protein [Fictibacillus barbaricus]MDR7073305.1 hypothetical protein [Fictibacillus barbaricus]